MGDLARFWPRLRKEAHELYREAALLRGRVRELERALAAAERSLAQARETSERQQNEADALRRHLAAVESSRGWRFIMRIRRLRGRSGSPAAREIPSAAQPSNPTTTTPPPTAAQRWAAEARRRKDARTTLSAWAARAREAHGSIVVALAGDPSQERAQREIRSSTGQGNAVCVLDRALVDDGLFTSIPPDIDPSLAPDLLATDFGPKTKILICTTADHTAVRWLVPAQQAGWYTAVVASAEPSSPAMKYLATHADAVVTGEISFEEMAETARSAAPSLPRVVLGITQ